MLVLDLSVGLLIQCDLLDGGDGGVAAGLLVTANVLCVALPLLYAAALLLARAGSPRAAGHKTMRRGQTLPSSQAF